MPTTKPDPVFELIFAGGGIVPERIPIEKVSRALSAVRRLTAGVVLGDEDEDEDETDDSIRLLDVKRNSSAVFRFVGASPALAIGRLKETGKFLKDPENAGASEYILRPIKDLSAVADSLGCSLLLRQASKAHEILAEVEADSYSRIAGSLLISGSTKLSGSVERVGGATAMRCALRVPFQNRLLFCKVESQAIARQLGEFLYQRVIAYGTAHWLKHSMRIFSFTIKDVSQTKAGSISEHLEALWEAGLNDWERMNDPDAYLQEIRGNE